MTADDAPGEDPPLIRTERPRPDQPILITGPAASAILSADGSFSLRLDTRGTPLEWGGVYAQGVRLCGPWSVLVGPPGSAVRLGPTTLRSLRHWRWGVQTVHDVAGVSVTDDLLPLTETPGVGRELTIRGTDASLSKWRVELELPLSLAPVLIEGVEPYSYELATRDTTIRATAHGSALALDSDPLPSRMTVDAAPWIGGRRTVGRSTLRVEYDLPLRPDSPTSFAFALWGGLEATVEGDPTAGKTALAGRTGWRSRAERPWREWSAQLPRLATPDDPALSEGFRLAAGALRALYTDPEPGMSGLVAGYPWYSALWFRDIAWMLPAVLWLGDVDRVLATLETAFRFQAPADIPLLGAMDGELPMQLSPGPVFLYGTSDTTLYYPGIVRRLVRHTGNADGARPYRKSLAKILSWGLEKVDSDTGLFTNGGEVTAMADAAEEVGRVHYGIDAFDTTIWDSADRRDHAVDLQVLWWECLDALAELEHPPEGPRATELRARAAAAKATFAGRYGWAVQRYLYDSIRRDGTPRAIVRPNALRAAHLGLVDESTARAISERAGEDDLTTEWGVRTLSRSDPTYDPLAYHEGQVWSIATAWAAAAALRTGRTDAGVRFLDVLADRIRAEGGYAHECYRGDLPLPFNSCFLLGFSVAPFLTTVFEELWGLTPHLDARTIECRPRFPAAWRSASLQGVRLGPGTLDLAWVPGSVEARWLGPWSVHLAGDRGTITLAPGTSATLPVPSASPPS
jgi:hypothetical protein